MYHIAITSRLHSNGYFFINKTYISFLSSAFFIEVVLPRSHHHYQDIVQRNDALLICGGNDIDAYYLKENQHPSSILEDSSIEAMDFALLHQFYHAHKPIFGICRGIQVINTFFKGTLCQDIPSFYTTPFSHSQDSHYIEIQKETFLSRYFPNKTLVNSFHHQCLKKASLLFHVNAISEDGLIEGIENKNVIAVQWHPERMSSYFQNQFLLMMKDFIFLHHASISP